MKKMPKDYRELQKAVKKLLIMDAWRLLQPNGRVNKKIANSLAHVIAFAVKLKWPIDSKTQTIYIVGHPRNGDCALTKKKAEHVANLLATYQSIGTRKPAGVLVTEMRAVRQKSWRVRESQWITEDNDAEHKAGTV
jgi:hypothetical protein